MFFLCIVYICNFVNKSKSGLRRLKKQITDTSLPSQTKLIFTGVPSQNRQGCWLLRTNFLSALCHGAVKSFLMLTRLSYVDFSYVHIYARTGTIQL